MASLNIPNDIVDGAAVEAVVLQQNFDAVETFINGDLIHADGATAMTGPLLLAGEATAPLGAVPLVQMEDADTVVADSVVAAIGTASADATSKADAAEAAAVVTANAYTDTKAHHPTFKATTGSGALYHPTRNVQTVLSVPAFVESGPGYYVVSCVLDMQEWDNGGVDTFVGELFVEGVLAEGQMLMYTGHNTRLTLSQTWIVPYTDASTNFQVKIRSTSVSPFVAQQFSVNTSDHSALSVLYVGL